MTRANPGGVLKESSERRWWMQKEEKKERVDIVVGLRPARMVSARASLGVKDVAPRVAGCFGPFPQLPDYLITLITYYLPIYCTLYLASAFTRSHGQPVGPVDRTAPARLFLRLPPPLPTCPPRRSD